MGQARLRAPVQPDHPAGRRRLRLRFHAWQREGVVIPGMSAIALTGEVRARLGEPRRMTAESASRASFETPRKGAAPQDDGGIRSGPVLCFLSRTCAATWMYTLPPPDALR